MAFRKTLIDRLFTVSKTSKALSLAPSSSRQSPPISSFLQRLLFRSIPAEEELFRRFLHQNASTSKKNAIPAERLGLPVGDELIERLKGLNGERLHLDALSHPIPPDRKEKRGVMTVEEARKILRVSEMEAVKMRLRGVKASSISYSDFVRICRDRSSTDHGVEIAKSLDESGAVLVLGDIVFLRPEQE